jgi:hypothetical protein
MKAETLGNLIWVAIWAILGLSALIGAIFFGAYWHFFTAGMCFVMAIVLYNDNAYGCESVKHYFEKVARAKRIR